METDAKTFARTKLPAFFINTTDKRERHREKELGPEVDFVLTYPLRKYITLQAGYSVMFPTEAMTVYKGGDHTIWQDWGFITVNINPTLFKTKF